MKKEYTIEQVAETRWFYKFTEPNAKGETLIIELSLCTNSGSKHALPILWKQKGHIDRVLETYWCFDTYVTDTEGMCYGRYNPQSKLSEDGKSSVINFDWMFEATEENKEKLIDETLKIFYSQEGETATEIKVRKVKEYAEKNNIELLTEIPNGWKDIGGMTAPIGSTWISNNGSFRDRSRKTALLLV